VTAVSLDALTPAHPITGALWRRDRSDTYLITRSPTALDSCVLDAAVGCSTGAAMRRACADGDRIVERVLCVSVAEHPAGSRTGLGGGRPLSTCASEPTGSTVRRRDRREPLQIVRRSTARTKAEVRVRGRVGRFGGSEFKERT
jgi:hypothetical protein